MKQRDPLAIQAAALATEYGVPADRLREEWIERASIREYLGNMPREDAEIAAIYDACNVLGLPEPAV